MRQEFTATVTTNRACDALLDLVNDLCQQGYEPVDIAIALGNLAGQFAEMGHAADVFVGMTMGGVLVRDEIAKGGA